MDFKLTEDQETLRKLAAKIFAEHCDDKGLREAEARGFFHERLWRALADAGLLGCVVPESEGGAGLGFIELCVLLEQAGRAAAPVPLVPSLAMAALPIARFGTMAQRQRWLPALADGRLVLSAALVEEDHGDPARPRTEAAPDGEGFVLRGEKIAVPAADRAARILLCARAGDGVAVVLLDPKSEGVTLEPQVATSGEPVFRLRLDGARVPAEDVLAGPAKGPEVIAFTAERATAALCALELGVASRQLEMISEYVTRRAQFGKLIGLFQAVAQRAASAYIDVLSIRLATWQAAWRIAGDLPAAQPVAVAKYWASEAGHRVAAAAQHLHGGMGFDKGYPLYRYYLLAKQIELTLGGANAQLSRLGMMLAEEGARPV